jgi:hypothetical protein
VFLVSYSKNNIYVYFWKAKNMRFFAISFILLSFFNTACGPGAEEGSDETIKYCVPENSKDSCHESKLGCLSGSAGNNWKEQTEPCSTENIIGKCSSVLGVFYHYTKASAEDAKKHCSSFDLGKWSDG